MEAQRLERRKALQAQKLQRQEENRRNVAAGNPGDVDFMGLVQTWRNLHAKEALPLQPLQLAGGGQHQPPRICVAVRKRPLMEYERSKCDHDSVTILHPKVHIHVAKYKVDGITKYLDHASFQFDYAFDETSDTSDVYHCTAMPLLQFACQQGGRATIFCYGQTGSGKTHTMQGLQSLLAHDLFEMLHHHNNNDDDGDTVQVALSFYELYGGYLQDLLNDRHRLKVLEDGKGGINVHGLTERVVDTADDFLQVLAEGNSARTTHVTQANDASSRSHAICQIVLRKSTAKGGGGVGSRTRSSGHTNPSSTVYGKLSLVDLAGSERGNDTSSHNAQRRAESADINTSLLALKECIRALGDGTSKHIPYRGSKLTLILKDCFAAPDARTAMIATVSPGASSADHSLNTLRYADRVMDRHPKKSHPPPADARSKGGASRTTTTSTTPPRPRQGLHPLPAVTVVPPPNSRSPPPPPPPPRRQPVPPPPRPSSTYSSVAPPVQKSSTRAATTGPGRTVGSSSAPPPLAPPRQPPPPGPTANRGGETQGKEDLDLDNLLDLSDDEEDNNDLRNGGVSRKVKPAVDAGQHTGRDRVTSTAPQDDLDARELLLKQLEDDLLNAHMGNIQENAELLAEEGTLLQNAQRPEATMDELRDYADFLERILDRKEDMILALQERMEAFKVHLQ